MRHPAALGAAQLRRETLVFPLSVYRQACFEALQVERHRAVLPPYCDPSTADLCLPARRRTRPYQWATVGTASQIGR
jgi:hypothetical protein